MSLKIMLMSITFAAAPVAGFAYAASIEDMCVQAADEWGSEGDIAGQCSCIADAAASDDDFATEFVELIESFSSDAEAYEAASDSAKAIIDACVA